LIYTYTSYKFTYEFLRQKCCVTQIFVYDIMKKTSTESVKVYNIHQEPK